jgi:hypothetical protein
MNLNQVVVNGWFAFNGFCAVKALAAIPMIMVATATIEILNLFMFFVLKIINKNTRADQARLVHPPAEPVCLIAIIFSGCF